MLEGIAANDIIVGAYTNGDGICPMLAAHRAGGRCSAISFARAWDRFAARDSLTRRPRPASDRELLILRTHLQASLLAQDAPGADLAAARAEHLELARRTAAAAAAAAADAAPTPARREAAPARRGRPGDPDRARELAHRPGWAWSRVVRRYDEYERVLERVNAARAAAESAEAAEAAEPVESAI